MEKDIQLHPPLVLAGRSEQLAKDEEAIASAANPRDNSLAVYLGPMVCVQRSIIVHSLTMSSDRREPIHLGTRG